jgi:hypothetical protein
MFREFRASEGLPAFVAGQERAITMVEFLQLGESG